MGFFSWLTCDKKEAIMNAHSGHSRGNLTVHLLQPGGKGPVSGRYDGYGNIVTESGETVNIYAWFARTNAEHYGIDVTGLDDDALHDIGTTLSFGCSRDTRNGRLWSFHGYPGASPHGIFCDPVKTDYGMEIPSELLESGVWEHHNPEPKYPIKLSYSGKAVYEDYPASENARGQGYFYCDDEEDLD